ncbi:transporter [Pectobacterium parvum]|uniref:MFS transporter n=1 Tax=Pectobacterium parvum TaxID=2778550 RepID=UPI000504541A|nr:MFS transporter [Pectobacterium parvum]KFX18646.1 transporter [Pectobacterium parvum]
MNTSSSIPLGAAAQHSWLAVIAVGLATFSVVTTEMLPVGLLTPIADTLQTSTGTAGLMISLPALLVIANIASALAPDIGWMLAARVLVGFCMGGIWAIAGGLAARLIPEHAIGLATSIIFGGVAAASVLGVPFGALIGDLAGWRWAFGCMAVFSGLVLVLHLAVIPALPVAHSVTLRQFGKQLSNRKLQVGLTLTLLLVAGHFMAFTFVRPLLLSVSGFDARWIGVLLFAYGIAGIIGNFLAGIIAAQRTALTLMAIALGLLLTPILFLIIGGSHFGGGVTLLVWGLAYGGVSVGLMTWMMKAAPRAVEIASALYVGIFNVGIALGSWVGGQVVDSSGPIATLWLAGGLAVAALLLSLSMKLTESRKNVE